MTTPAIATLGRSLLPGLPLDTALFNNLAQLLEAPPYDILALDLSGTEAGAVLEHLRRHPHYAARLVYVREDDDPLCKALGDGRLPPSTESIRASWRTWVEQFACLPSDHQHIPFDDRILNWLWLHPKSRLQAVRDPDAPQYYRYPLIEALDPDNSLNRLAWPIQMQQRGWLESVELVDRVRTCPECGSARLNFIDVCGECRSIDIAREHALHCFTCGHVGPQERFIKSGVLVCPNCMTRLRHIGSDYDRPLENYRCHHCDAFFVDATVEAHCLACGSSCAPEKLHARELRHYRLSETGRLRCRQGGAQADEELNQTGPFHLVGIRTFRSLLDWQIELARRHGEPSFSVLGIRLTEMPEVIARMDAERAHVLLDSVIERLSQQLRDTDRCARASDELLWVLLPRTDDAGCRRLVSRLRRIDSLFDATEARGIRLAAIVRHAPAQLRDKEDASLLLADMAAELF